ncbi:hypothetical protein [Gluconobacter morbifer]|nr:hypothetical protein [Gluconobacter morbifer]
MSHDHVSHPHSSMREVAQKATHSSKLLTKEEIILLAEHVAKRVGSTTEEEREIAKKAIRNPEGAESHDLSKLGERALQDR